MMPTMARRPKKPATWHVEIEVLDALKELSEALNVRQSEIVRLALSCGVAKLKKAVEDGKSSHAALAYLQDME